MNAHTQAFDAVGTSDALLCVDPAKVDAIWPHVRPFIEQAYLTGLGDETPESIKADLDSVSALLWIVWDGKGLIAAAVTQVMQSPAKKLCIIKCCAGRELPRWLKFLAEIEAYARAQGCAVMRVYGRHGWRKHLADYAEPWIALEKDLH